VKSLFKCVDVFSLSTEREAQHEVWYGCRKKKSFHFCCWTANKFKFSLV